MSQAAAKDQEMDRAHRGSKNERLDEERTEVMEKTRIQTKERKFSMNNGEKWLN